MSDEKYCRCGTERELVGSAQGFANGESGHCRACGSPPWHMSLSELLDTYEQIFGVRHEQTQDRLDSE